MERQNWFAIFTLATVISLVLGVSVVWSTTRVETTIASSPASSVVTQTPERAVPVGGVVTLETSGVELSVLGTQRVPLIKNEKEEWWPEDPSLEFLIVYLAMPSSEANWAVLDNWFSAGRGAEYPIVIDGQGHSRLWSFAIPAEEDGVLEVKLVFLVRKGDKNYELVFPDGVKLALAWLPEIASESAAPKQELGDNES